MSINVKEEFGGREYDIVGMKMILSMVESDQYELGEVHKLDGYYEDTTLSSFKQSKLTDDICNYLINYGKCKFSDVPQRARTRDFFLNAFSDNDVFQYIENHIGDFDRQFFKDLIATNHYSLTFSNNAFAVMPLDYIDSEMVDIAFLSATDWSNAEWFQSVIKRKPEVITYQAWLCAARYYGTCFNVLKDMPQAYKTKTMYYEIMSYSFNVGMELLSSDKDRTILNIPEEVMTPEFLRDVICLEVENVARIPEKYKDTIIDIKGKKLKLWEVAILAEAKTITEMDPTQERIDFFKKKWGESGFKYDLYCKAVEEQFNRK